MPVGNATGTRANSSNVDSLFDTTPPARPQPAAPARISDAMKLQLLTRIQEERQANHGYPPAMLGGAKAEQLKAAIASGDAVEVRINANITAVLKKSDDLEGAKSFFYKTSGGFAGTQFFGPFDV